MMNKPLRALSIELGGAVALLLAGGQAAAVKYSASASAGVLHPSVLRGRPFNAAATA